MPGLEVPLHRRELDQLTCDEPGCDHTAENGLEMHPGCHEYAAVEVLYKQGVLFFRCALCGAPLDSMIAVAE